MRFTLTLCLFTIIVTTASSQNIAFQAAEPHPNIQGGLFGDLHFSDIDGDGDIDLFICGRTDGWVSVAATKLYLNDGQGNFTEVSDSGITAMQSATAAMHDFDEDGDEDLLLCGLATGSTVAAELYLNDGQGQFSLMPSAPFRPNTNGDIAIGDVNADGHQDVFLMGTDVDGLAFNVLYLNEGSGNFVEVEATPFLSIHEGAIALVDMDGDEDLDLFCMGQDEAGEPVTILHLNDGLGNFSAAPAGIEDFSLGDFAIGDLDGDGDMDILLSGTKSDNMAHSELYLNDGSGMFTLFMGSEVFPDLSLGANAFADLDGDEDLDIVLVGTGDGGLGGEIGIITNVFENLGDNTYVLADSLTGAYFAGLALGDVNGDEKQDLMITGTTVGQPTFKTWLFFNTSELSVGLIEKEEKRLEVFPNPSDGLFNIQVEESNESIIEVYNQHGALVHSGILRNNTQQLDLKLADGLYTLLLRSGGAIVERKITILR